MASTLPFITEFGLQPDLQPDYVSDATQVDATPPSPLGVDIAFDATGEDFLLTPEFDLNICSEAVALSQWVQTALITKRGTELIFSPDFGSDLPDIIGTSTFTINDIEEQVIVAIESALSFHDRIDNIQSVRIGFIDDYRLAFEATVILDDNAVLTFNGATSLG